MLTSVSVILTLAMMLGLIILVITINTSAAVKLAGERFFANGTGIAYLDDGTTKTFDHRITPQNGYYYDNSTVFYAGIIPSISNDSSTSSNSTSTVFCNSRSATPNNAANGNTTTVSILFGASDLGNKSFSPNPVKIKVGDTVTWINHDHYSRDLFSSIS